MRTQKKTQYFQRQEIISTNQKSFGILLHQLIHVCSKKNVRR